jgi:hypothetical protein
MKVKATAPGFYEKYIESGEEFDVPSGTKGSWFTPVVKKPEGKKPEDSNDPV